MPWGALASFVLFAFIFGFRPHMASAGPAEQHAAVERMMCVDMPMICPCHAYNLQVNYSTGGAMTCGESQTTTAMEMVPIILPPVGMQLYADALYIVMIINRDYPSRTDPRFRYRLMGIYTDLTSDDLHAGFWLRTGVNLFYTGPNPLQGSGDHTYQILMLKQDLDLEGVHFDTNAIPFDAQWFMQVENMCWEAGHLIGAFEFSCSYMSLENEPVIPGRPCPDPSATTTSVTGTTLKPTDTSRADTSTAATNGISMISSNGISTISSNGISTLSSNGTLSGNEKSTLSSNGISTLSSNETSTLSGNEKSTLSSNKKSTLSSNEKSTLSSNEKSTLSSNEKSTLSSNEKSTLSSNEKSTLSSNEESTLSSNEKSTLSSNEKMKSNTSTPKGDYSLAGGSTRSIRCDISLALVAAILFRVLRP